MWWIIGICLLAVIVIALFLFVRGADMRQRNTEYRMVADDEQESQVAQMLKEQ